MAAALQTSAFRGSVQAFQAKHTKGAQRGQLQVRRAGSVRRPHPAWLQWPGGCSASLARLSPSPMLCKCGCAAAPAHLAAGARPPAN